MKLKIAEHTIEDSLLYPDFSVVDLGACHGEFAEQLSTVYPHFARYIMVEANQELASRLASKFSQDRFLVVNKACSCKGNAVLDFYVDPAPYLSSYLFRGPSAKLQPVESITLRDIIDQFALNQIDLLKIDIEGAEWDILPLFDQSLFNVVSQITLEFHDFIDPAFTAKSAQCVSHLCSLGYTVETRGTNYLFGSEFYDCLFVKSSRI